MAGNYDGSIRIDTAINTAPIDNGLGQIENKIKGLAGTIGLAFGIKELVDFGKRSIDAASDLAEAQNVVDTAFGEMSYKMEQFADTALETYGISELTAKKMGSTYMAMAKGMGVATDAASDMAVTLTGRLSDIMSFYNKTQSEVDTIGRALITGETEPLKAIGVVMTQTNLSAYAMAQGFSKAYTEMSSNEQLLVRYKYFLEQTALAQGDFAKTSEGWANQTRLLSERINEFMTNLGGLIVNTLTPALQFANEAVSFLNELFFGGKDNVEDASAVKNAEAVTDEVTSMGTAAEKSEKKLNNLLSGFDELHIISGAKSDDEDKTEGAGIDTSNLLGVNLEADTSTAKKAAGKYRDIINEIYLAFKTHPLTKAVEKIIKKLGEFFGFFKNNGKIDAGKLTKALMDILGAILAYKSISAATKGVLAFGKGFSGLIGLITAHPLAAAAVGITALTVGILELDKELRHQRIVSYFGDISISLEEIDELIDPITADADKVAEAFADNKERLNTARDNFNEIAEAVQDTADAFKDGNIDQNVEDFAKQIDDFIDSSLEVNNAVYDTSALEKVFASDGEIDDEEQKILDRFNEFGGTVADKIETIRSQIHEITQGAINENRGLLESEIKNIQDLYDQIAEMTAQQEDVKTTATWERLKNGDYSYDSYAELAEQIKAAQEQGKKSRQAAQQAAYENTIMKANDMRSKGASESEIEAMKKEAFTHIDKNMRELEIKEKQYEWEVISAYSEGALSNMSKGLEIEEQKRLKDYFNLLTSMPEDFDLEKLEREIGAEAKNSIIAAMAMSLAMEQEVGLNPIEEWEKLNEEIGDAGVNVEEFYSSLSSIAERYGLNVDDFLPDTEEFKNQLNESSKVIDEWASATNPQITVTMNPDMELVDKFMNGGHDWLISNGGLIGTAGLLFPPTHFSDEKSSQLEVWIYNNDEQVAETQMDIGTSAKEVIDNGKSGGGGGRHR